MRRPIAAVERVSAGFDRLPIRIRLAAVSALLTFVILCAFALAIGSLTVHRIRSDFNRQVSDTATDLPNQMVITRDPYLNISTPLNDFTADHAIVKVLGIAGEVLKQEPARAPSFGAPDFKQAVTVHGYRVVSVLLGVRVAATGERIGHLIVQYARPVGPTEATVQARRAVPDRRRDRRFGPRADRRDGDRPAGRWRRSPP